MDIFTDAARLHQIHDINPGNGGIPGAPAGPFWTVPLPPSGLRARGNHARIDINNLQMLDFFQLFAPSPALACLDVSAAWEGNLGPVHLNETSNGSRFIFDGMRTNIEMQWRASTQVSTTNSAPFTFHTVGAATTVFAEIGIERNGVFA